MRSKVQSPHCSPPSHHPSPVSANRHHTKGPRLTASPGSAQFVTTWQEYGLQRFRFTFQGVSTDNYGQDFLWAIREQGGITSNWQCWYDDELGAWTFDDSEFADCGGVITIFQGVNAVTGQTSEQMGLDPAYSALGCEGYKKK